MPHLEPTYLRYIYDGLTKGSIHPENAAELPDGLIGMYEEAFDERTSVIERQKLLQRFAIWALLKKEVSAAFVAEVLEEPEDDIQELISTYSAWFNSPESGKYQLYHERLKVYLLQKLSECEIHALHEKLIERLEQVIEEQKADEFEWYGLEFLTSHLAVTAMLNGDGKKLIYFAYSQTYWQRQLKISKGFSWTKNGLKEVMSWASKYNDDEIIECGLQMVDLHHQEQNAAPQIVAMIADGDFDVALKRIEQFGGNDKEGLERKFILYMLCLMELTLLESKDKPYRKEGIEKLLKHLDEQLPVDHSILKWNDFFPSYTMFLMACEWVALELDYLIVYKRTNDWKKEWLSDIGSCNDIQFEVLLTCATGISDESVKSSAVSVIASELAKQGKVEEALTCARGISSDYWKSRALSGIATEIAIQGKVEEALTCARGIGSDYWKVTPLSVIATELAKQGKASASASAMQDAHTCARGIKFDKSIALKDISTELAKQGKVEEALTCARGISSDRWKSGALKDISIELAKQGKVYEAASAMQEALTCVRGISDEFWKSIALSDIATELAKLGKVAEAASAMQEAFTSARGISSDRAKSSALSDIATELAKQGKVEKAASAMQEALTCARGISDESDKSSALKDISTELAKQGKVAEAASAMQEALTSVGGISDEFWKSMALSDIATELAKQGKIEEALTCARGISSDHWKSSSLKDISIALAKQGKVKEALTCVRGISDESDKSSALKDISTELAKQGNWALAETTGLEIPISNVRNLCWQNIANNFVNESSWHKALEVLNQSKSFDVKYHFLKGFSISIRAYECSENLFFTVIGFYKNNLNSMETLLQKHALYKLFFEDASELRIKRFNRTLNIQWAIDIKNQLPN
jgi:tetratricopeptide (TPR) repeat protein